MNAICDPAFIADTLALSQFSFRSRFSAAGEDALNVVKLGKYLGQGTANRRLIFTRIAIKVSDHSDQTRTGGQSKFGLQRSAGRPKPLGIGTVVENGEMPIGIESIRFL